MPRFLVIYERGSRLKLFQAVVKRTFVHRRQVRLQVAVHEHPWRHQLVAHLARNFLPVVLHDVLLQSALDGVGFCAGRAWVMSFVVNGGTVLVQLHSRREHLAALAWMFLDDVRVENVFVVL